MDRREFLTLGAAGTAAAALATAGFAQGNAAGDWPQWRGPLRDGVSRETGLLKIWPQGGPPLAWKATGCGLGYTTPSVAAGRILGMGNVGQAEVVWAKDARTGQTMWSTPIAQAVKADRGDGSRGTPTIDGARVYAEGISGDVVCLDAATGRIIWRKHLVRDFGGGVPNWGYSESPLVDGEKVIVTPGGQNTMVALNKATGQTVWTSQVPDRDGAQYSSPILATVGGQRQYIQFLQKGVIGVSAQDGHFLWRYRSPANGVANCATPIFSDNCVFAASNYGVGGGLARLENGGATEVYFTKRMQNHHGGVILVDGYLYGFDGANLTCLDFKTGEVKWFNRSVGKGSLVAADGHLICRGESGGGVALVEATPRAYVEKSRFTQPDQSGGFTWPHPVVANGRLLLRDQDVLLAYDLK